jgi:hypothetical protein
MTRGSQLVLAMFLVLWSFTPAKSFGQAAWEYTPYHATVWLALESTPQLPTRLVASLGDAVSSREDAAWGAMLQIQVIPAPAKSRALLLQNLDDVMAEQIAAVADRQDLETDKLYLAALARREGNIVVRVREFDCRSRQLGPIIERSCPAVVALTSTLWDALAESFTPLARIEHVEDQHIVARLRAAGLVAGDHSPALVEPGMVLRPVVRRNDRNGQPAKGGIQPISWSFLVVDRRSDSILECSLRSGYRAAIPPRGGVRIERLALLVKPRYEATRLVLRSRSDASKPLAGYEVHRRLPDSQETDLLGITDSHGAVLLPRTGGALEMAGSLEMLLVKNGKQLLSRLPVVPGYEKTLTASIVDDDGRLAAEGFVAALSSRALDLVARREILAARIRTRIKEGKINEAQQLLDEFRRLETRAELNRDLDRFRQQITANDKLTQARIERVFADAQKLLLLKPLSDDLLAQLTREVSTAAPTGG